MRASGSRSLRAAFLVLTAFAGGASARADDEAQTPTRKRPGRTVLVVMDRVVERMLPRLLDSPREESRRVSVKDGLLGIGAWSPPGGEGYGVMAPPLHLFPRAGAGSSLNIDPTTGRSYFGWP
jgi:hypothetical protein